ncbi:hypothetical protein BOX15_Mlig016512g1 [Macrostomum lignano]|uniref:Uncharacterized protein n=1 Tax=Macrostomum lignano TaxID=282301 RepID=A0A267EQ87_9PLAT|nr:hypothetical protein BOX15_Mlig016512g1 [Macrostomum lignano]
MISNELQLLLLASNRQSWCSIRGRMKHLLQLSHRCWSSGGGARLDSQLAQWQSRVPPALNAPPVSSNARTVWHCERLGTESVDRWPHQSESQLPLVLMSAAKPPPEPQPSQKQQQKKERQRKQQQEDKEAIERLKIEMKRLQDRTTISYKNPCKVSANYKKTCTIDELNAVKYHFEEFLPRFFVSMMDYSLFTPDVVYINEMQTPHKTSKGVYRLSVDRVKLKLYYDLRYAMKKPVILRIDTDRENCCMAIRLRVRCVGGSKPFTDLARMNQLGTAAYIEEKGEWHDYLIHAHVTSDARVWKLRVTNLTRTAVRTQPLADCRCCSGCGNYCGVGRLCPRLSDSAGLNN